MNRNEYRLDVLQSVFQRLGYVVSMEYQNFQLLTHTVSGSEIILDTSYPVVVAALMERKLQEDLEIPEIYFESLFDAEIKQFVGNNPSHE